MVKNRRRGGVSPSGSRAAARRGTQRLPHICLPTPSQIPQRCHPRLYAEDPWCGGREASRLCRDRAGRACRAMGPRDEPEDDKCWGVAREKQKGVRGLPEQVAGGSPPPKAHLKELALQNPHRSPSVQQLKPSPFAMTPALNPLQILSFEDPR